MKNCHKLAALAGVAMATAAFAQPGSFTDLGDHSVSASTFTQAVHLNSPSDIQWFKIVLPNASNGAGGYVDIWTSTGGAVPQTDTEIGIYDNFGNMIANDDDDDDGLFSAMSFGTTTPARPANGTGVAFNGRDGNFFSAGTYWVAEGRFNVTFNPTGWSVTSSSTTAQYDTILNFRIQPDGAPVPPSGTGAATPSSIQAGYDSLLTVTVTPGANPPSTGVAVSANLSALGGSGTQAFYDDGTHGDQYAGDNVYSYYFTTDANAAFGTYQLPYTVSDAQSRSTSGNIALTIIAPPPANDDCYSAQIVNEGTFAFDSTQATSDGVVTCITNTSADIWYKYIPTFDGVTNFSTCGSSFDTVLSLWDSCGGAMLACNDDSCGLQSQILAYPVSTGVPIYVRVARYYSGPGGPGTLTIQAPPPSNPTGVGACNPNPVYTGNNGLFTVTVTPGANPASQNLAVSVDMSGLGGSSSQAFYDDGTNGDQIPGDNVFSFDYNVPTGTGVGSHTLAFTITDDYPRTGTGSFAVNVTAPPSWDEAINGGGDCGDLPFSAQVPSDTGTGSLQVIAGSIGFSGDVDMYQIDICDPSTFSASTIVNSVISDTQLFLFDANGVGVAVDDDDPQGTGGLRSRLSNLYVYNPGTYFLAVSGYNTDPQDEVGQLLWNNTPFNTERAPDGPGAFNPVASWTGTSGTGAYNISLTGACFSGGSGGCQPVCDYNQDGGADLSDVFDLANDIASGTESYPGSCSDYNQDGGSDTSDVLDLANAIASGTC